MSINRQLSAQSLGGLVSNFDEDSFSDCKGEERRGSVTYEDAVADEGLGCEDAHAHDHEGGSEVANQLSEPRVADLTRLLELRSALRIEKKNREEEKNRKEQNR